MPSILQKQTTRETDPLTLRGEVANTAIPIILGTTDTPMTVNSTTQLTTGQASVGHYICRVGAYRTPLITVHFTLFHVQA